MPRAAALVRLDVEGSGRFVLSGDHSDDLVRPVDLPWEHVHQALEDDRFFMERVAGGRSLPLQRVGALRNSWAAAHGLVTGNDLSRLMWTVDQFAADIEVDLLRQYGVRLSDLWRARRWRELLNLIDHLPRASWTQQAMLNHPEYAERVAEAIQHRRERLTDPEDDGAPPLVEHTPEVAMLAGVIDAVNALRTTLIMANSAKGAQPPKIPPYPRPRTLVDRMAAKARTRKAWATHESLVARLLPNRPKGDQ